MNGTGLRRMHRRRWALVLLPLLLLRALVPVGFMPAVGAGSFALMFCDAATGIGAGAHAHHHGHGQGPAASGQAGHAAAPDCPYAQSAAPPLLAVTAVPPTAPRADAPAGWPAVLEAPRPPPPRHAAARGPPLDS
jgi:hypothetical protein